MIWQNVFLSNIMEKYIQVRNFSLGTHAYDKERIKKNENFSFWSLTESTAKSIFVERL